MNKRRSAHPPPPRPRSRFSGCFRWLALLLIVAGGIYIWHTYQPSGRAADLAPAISTFTNDPDLLVKQTGTDRTPYGRVKQYSAMLANGDEVYFDVDENDNVSSFFRAKQPNGRVIISMEQARMTAIDFVTTHYSDLSWLDAVQASETLTGTDGSSNRFYTFEWRRQDPNSGAFLPQVVKIEVNAQTGKVDSSIMLNEPVTISTTPTIDQATATQAALSALPETADFKVEEVILTILTLPLFEPSGEPALVWSITATAKPDETGYIAGAVIFVDAQTGEILLVDQFV